MQTTYDISQVLIVSGACVAFLLGRFFLALLGIGPVGPGKTSQQAPRVGRKHDLSHFTPPAGID